MTRPRDRAPAACRVEACGRPVLARGLCGAHYRRWRTYGDALAGATRPPVRPCAVEGCGRPSRARGWCGMHYGRWRAHGSPAFVPDRLPACCSVEGCTRPVHRRGLCSHHRALALRSNPAGPRCSVEGCGQAGQLRRGMCNLHYQRWRRSGDPLTSRRGPPTACSVAGCTKPAKAQGMCGTHYQAWRRRSRAQH